MNLSVCKMQRNQLVLRGQSVLSPDLAHLHDFWGKFVPLSTTFTVKALSLDSWDDLIGLLGVTPPIPTIMHFLTVCLVKTTLPTGIWPSGLTSPSPDLPLCLIQKCFSYFFLFEHEDRAHLYQSH